MRKTREYRDGPRRPAREEGRISRMRPIKIKLTEDERFMQACLVVSRRNQRIEPYQIAMEAKGWSREQWESAHAAFEARQLDRWRQGGHAVGDNSLCGLN